MAGLEPPGWRDARGTATLARALLVAAALMSAMSAAASLLRGFDLNNAGILDVLIQLAQILLYLAAVIVSLRWLYLAKSNARALGADDMLVSPGWAVAWFFIPLANLVMPYVAVRELWKASENPRDWQAGPSPPIILVWWLFWVAGSIASAVAYRLTDEVGKQAGDAPQIFHVAALLLGVVGLLLLASIIGSVQAMQARASPGSAEALRDRFA